MNISVSADFKTACESYEWYDGGTAIKVVSTYCKFDGTNWTDVSAYTKQIDIDGSYDPITGLSKGATAAMRFANDDLRFSDLYAAGPYYGTLLPNIEVKVDVAVSTESVTIFTGRVDDNGFFEDREGGAGFARIWAQDPARALMLKKFDKDYVYSDMLLLDCANVASSLMHTLVIDHGEVTAANVVSTGQTISYTVDYARFRQGESIWQAVKSLADACSMLYCGFRYDGKFVFESRIEDSWTDPASEYTITANTYEVSVRKDLLPVTGNKVKIRGSNITLRDESTVLWELRKIKPLGGNAKYRNMCWEPVANGDYFLCDLSLSPPRDYYAQYDIEGEDIIETSDHLMTQTTESGTDLTDAGTLLHIQPRRGRIVLQNLTGATQYVKNIVITGKAITKRTIRTRQPDAELLSSLMMERGLSNDDANWGRVYQIEAGLSIGAYGEKNIVISSDLIVDDEQMRVIGDFLLKYGKDPRRGFTLAKLPFMPFLQCGAVTTLDLSDIGYSGETDLVSYRHRITPDSGGNTTLTLIERVPNWDPHGYVVIDGGAADGN